MPLLGQLLLERGPHRHAIKHRVHRHPGQPLALLQRNPQLLVGLQQLRINLLQAPRPIALLLRRGIIHRALVINRRVMHMRPRRLLHRQPMAIRLEPPLQHELRLILLRRDQADDVLIQARRRRVGLHVGEEAVLVFLLDQSFNCLRRCAHLDSINSLALLNSPRPSHAALRRKPGIAHESQYHTVPPGNPSAAQSRSPPANQCQKHCRTESQ